jgi:hypothetical protein
MTTTLTLEQVLRSVNPTIVSPDNETPQIEIDYLNLMLVFLSTPEFGAFPISAWEDGSPFKGLLQSDAHAIASLASTNYNVIKGGILDLSENEWLDFWGQSQYQETRHSSVQQVGKLWCTIQAPVHLAAGELKVGASATQEYQSVELVDGIYVPAAVNLTDTSYPSTQQILIQALSTTPGSAGATEAGAIDRIVSPNVPGMTVTNLNPDNTGVWEVVRGIDAEQDDAFRKRLKSKWPSLSLLRATTKDAWGFWITQADPNVRRWNVVEAYPTGGQVTIYLDPGTEVAAVDDWISGATPRRPLCTQVHIVACDTATISITGSVYVPQNLLANAQAAFATAIDRISTALPMGSKVYYSLVAGFVQSATGVDHHESLRLNATSADVALAANAIPLLVDNLTWIGF